MLTFLKKYEKKDKFYNDKIKYIILRRITQNLSNYAQYNIFDFIIIKFVVFFRIFSKRLALDHYGPISINCCSIFLQQRHF